VESGAFPEGVELTAADRVYAALAPPVFSLLHLGARLTGTDAAALRQRAGAMPACPAPCLWLHGASAGEMRAAANLVTLLRTRGGHHFHAAYTTTNAAGLHLISRHLVGDDVCALAPWDAPRWCARALDIWRPLALVLVETELWPGLIRLAVARRIPVLGASARIYPRDLRGYRLLRAFMRPTLRRLTAVLAQSGMEVKRFVALGAPPERCTVAGNLKHAATPAASAAAVDALRHALALAPGESPWVMGSLHADELAFIAPAVTRAVDSGQRVILAPRHRRGQRAVTRVARRHGWRLATRSGASRPADWQVLLLDTMGELGTAYALAQVAIVGGAFASHGGHDLVEPVRAGAPVVFGAHSEHVAAEAEALLAAEPSALVATPSALAERLSAWRNDEVLRQRIWQRQANALPDPAAIAARYCTALAPWLR
jgi:3-deoxy-D-manno-octulosonic-acid transferase